MDERILQMFVGRPVEQQFVALALATLLGQEKVNEILSGLNDTGRTGREEIAGRPLRFYSGLSKGQLKQIGLKDSEVEEVYEKLGVEDAEVSDVDPARASSAPVELAKLEEVPQEALPEAQVARVETELNADREEEGSTEPDSSGPEAGSPSDAEVMVLGTEDVPLSRSVTRKTKRGNK